MQLYISPTSPYARKAWMVVLEKGLKDEVEIIRVNPWGSPTELTSKNPLSQVPVLAIERDQSVYDSRVICAYLDSLRDEPPLLPEAAMERMAVLRMESLADGMSDVAVATFFARKDNGDNPDTPAIERQLGKIAAALKVMEGEVPNFEGKLSIWAPLLIARLLPISICAMKNCNGASKCRGWQHGLRRLPSAPPC